MAATLVAVIVAAAAVATVAAAATGVAAAGRITEFIGSGVDHNCSRCCLFVVSHSQLGCARVLTCALSLNW